MPHSWVGARAHHGFRWTLPPAMAARRAPLAPQVRGRVTPTTLAALQRDGWRVHRIGAAAYVHGRSDELRLIFGVWARRAQAPHWAGRLGRPSGGYLRRLDRVTAAAHAPFVGGDVPWYRWPSVGAYGFEPTIADPYAAGVAAIDAHNHRIRAARGLVACRPDDFPPYGEGRP